MTYDRYEPLEVVGRGGQGEVVRALDRLHDRPVALKVRTVSTDAEREEILREAKNLRALRPHPAVTLVREDFFLEDRYVMVMDWVEGRTLARVVEEEGSPGLPLARVVSVLAPVAEALDHLHGHSPPIAHGDVKPSNILLTPDGKIVVVDFGTSVRGPAAARTGTSGYLAPEIARGEPLAPAADTYALAATAFTLLTGGTFRHGVAPEWPDLEPGEARRIERALASALHPDPLRRPRSAGAFLAALAPPRRAPHNLPAQIGSFVGRRSEVRAVRAEMRRARLVTLAGPGGVGKTRLACAVGEESLAEFPDGVWLVPLAAVDDEALLLPELARALSVPAETGRSLSEDVATFLAEKRALVILDNAEHLLDAVASLARLLLEAAAGLAVVVTSREPLRIAGESVVRVAPLALPDASDARAVRSAAAVRLFCDRARSASRRFRLTAATAPAVVSICRRLDGLPLALELAAARLDVLAPEQVAVQLDERLLDMELRDRLPHHRMLRATVAWSYDLLGDAERVLLGRLGAFAGSIGAPAAAAVCAGDGVDGTAVPGMLVVLSEKSLLLPAEDARFGMLEAVRGFARERLDEAGEAPAVRRRHFEHFAALASEDAGPDRSAWLARLDAEHDELRAALRWSVTECGDPIGGLALAGRLGNFWLTRGYFVEGDSWLARALAAAGDAPERLRGVALNSAGHFAKEFGDFERARARYEESLAIWRALGDRVAVSVALNSLGNLESWLGNMEAARALHEESLAIKREMGDEPGVGIALTNLGLVMQYLGDLDAARALQEEALAVKRAVGDRQGEAYSLDNLAVIHRERGEHGAARALAAEALEIAQEIGDRGQVARVLETLAYVANAAGDPARAARVLGAAGALREALSSRVPPSEREHMEGELARARAALGEEAFVRAFAEGRAMTPGRAAADATAEP